jgi:aryl-alcohol dehydrogenase-like predicted oxidoreductase
MSMRTKLLGPSGLRVSELCLGTMTFGEEWGWGASQNECHHMFEAYASAGGNFIDTANKYTEGSSERIVGELVGSERDRFVIATKYTIQMRPGDPNSCGNHKKNLRQSVEASLTRLATDYIDLLWIHAWDFTTPVDEVLRALDDLVRGGKVLHIGISDTPAWVVAQANTLAELRGWNRFVGLQIEYSLVERTVERELLPMARAFGLPVAAWGAVGAGLLTGKYTRGGAPSGGRAEMVGKRMSERNLVIAREVDRVADELGASSTQVAIAWLKHQHPSILPIVGARTATQLVDALGAGALRLGTQQLARLDEVSRVELGFPHDFMREPGVIRNVYGDRHQELER